MKVQAKGKVHAVQVWSKIGLLPSRLFSSFKIGCRLYEMITVRQRLKSFIFSINGY